MTSPRYRVVLVDTHPLFAEALSQQIRREPDLEVVGAASDHLSGLRAVENLQPDLVVIDLDVPGRGVFCLAEDIAVRCPNVRMVFWGDYASDVILDQTIRAGASGLLLTRDPIATVIEAFRSVCRGNMAFSPQITERLEYDREARCFVTKHHRTLNALTTRQVTVLRLLIRGESVKDVARTMALSERAIESHKYRIMRRLGIHDRVELARYAIREGLAIP